METTGKNSSNPSGKSGTALFFLVAKDQPETVRDYSRSEVGRRV